MLSKVKDNDITPRPIILIPDFDTKNVRTRIPMIVLTKEDKDYLNMWREKARRKYKKYTGNYKPSDEELLNDPDPFECKWYIFNINKDTPNLKSYTPLPSPLLQSTTLSYTVPLIEDLKLF
jgi:hypothetical protein